MARVERPQQSLVLAFAAVTTAFLAATVYSQYWATRIDVPAVAIARHVSPAILHLAEARAELRDLEVLLVQETHDLDAGGPHHREEIDASRRRFDEHVHDYLATARDAWGDLDRRLGALDTTLARFQTALDLGDSAEARRLINAEVDPAIDRVSDALLHGVEVNAERAGQLAQEIEDRRRTSMGVAVVLNIVGAFAAVFAAVIVLRVVRGYGRLLESRHQLLARQAQELEAFAGRVSHDILSPLGAVGLSLEIVRAGVPAMDPAARLLERGRSALVRARRIVDDLLAFARSGASPEPDAFAEVAPIVGEIVQGLDAEAASAGVSLRASLDAGGAVACGPGVLTSLVENLARNAIKYMGDRAVKDVEVRSFDRGARVRIEVADTGPGIGPELLDLVFLPHVRAASAAGRPGLGLGLATVKRLVEAHGGAVGVESVVDQGSVFWFELPKAPERA